MSLRSSRLRARRRASRQPEGRAVGGGATDAIPGLGRVEQLVLRGDGLTTTSLEILTGERIDVVVDGHWQIEVADSTDERLPGGSLHFDHDGPDVDGYRAAGRLDLGAEAGEELLVREVLLIGTSGTVHGWAEVVGRLSALPSSVVVALATTDQPIGRLLRDAGVPIVRELHRWGFLLAGQRATRLGIGLEPRSRVLGRTYLMRSADTRQPVASLTERFCPHVFAEH